MVPGRRPPGENDDGAEVMKETGMPVRLKYGNTNTFLISGLLIDTDYAGTPGAF